VRLHFIEPDSLKPGARVFSVSLQGREVLKGLDVAREAAGPWRGVVREFRGVEVGDTLTVALSATAGVPVLSGIEVRAEE
jgi:beta-galactosidase